MYPIFSLRLCYVLVLSLLSLHWEMFAMSNECCIFGLCDNFPTQNRGGIGNLRLWVQIFNPPVNPWVKNLNTRMVYLKTDGYNIISNLWVIIFFAPKERCPRAKNLNTKEISSLVEFLGFLCENLHGIR